METIEYDFKIATLTFFVLMIGGMFVVMINHSNSIFKYDSIEWGNVFLFIIPLFLSISYLPLLITKALKK